MIVVYDNEGNKWKPCKTSVCVNKRQMILEKQVKTIYVNIKLNLNYGLELVYPILTLCGNCKYIHWTSIKRKIKWNPFKLEWKEKYIILRTFERKDYSQCVKKTKFLMACISWTMLIEKLFGQLPLSTLYKN